MTKLPEPVARATTHDECPQRRSSDKAHTALLIIRRRCNVAKRKDPSSATGIGATSSVCTQSVHVRFVRLHHVLTCSLAASRTGADWGATSEGEIREIDAAVREGREGGRERARAQ